MSSEVRMWIKPGGREQHVLYLCVWSLNNILTLQDLHREDQLCYRLECM